MPRTKNETIPSQFRLKPDTLADLDRVAEYLTAVDPAGMRRTRTDAVRFAAREAAKKIPKKFPKSA